MASAAGPPGYRRARLSALAAGGAFAKLTSPRGKLRAGEASRGILSDWLAWAYNQVERDCRKHRESRDNNRAIAFACSRRTIR